MKLIPLIFSANLTPTRKGHELFARLEDTKRFSLGTGFPFHQLVCIFRSQKPCLVGTSIISSSVSSFCAVFDSPPAFSISESYVSNEFALWRSAARSVRRSSAKLGCSAQLLSEKVQ